MSLGTTEKRVARACSSRSYMVVVGRRWRMVDKRCGGRETGEGCVTVTSEILEALVFLRLLLSPTEASRSQLGLLGICAARSIIK